MSNPLPHYFHLLGEAAEASEEADHYDLRGDVPETVTRFEELQKAQLDANKALVEYVQRHGNEIIEKLTAITPK